MASTNPQSLNQIVDIKDDDKIMVTGTDNVTQTIPGSTLKEFFCEAGSASGEAPAGAETKVVTLANSDTSKPWLSNYHKTSLPQQFKINIKFTAGNTYGNANTTYPKIQIKNADGTVLGTFNVCDSRGHVAGTGCWNAGDIMTFKAVGNLLLIQNSDVRTEGSGYIVYSDGKIIYESLYRETLATNKTCNAGGTTSITIPKSVKNYKYLEIIGRMVAEPSYQQHCLIDTINLNSNTYIRNIVMDVKIDIHYSSNTKINIIVYGNTNISIDLYGRM